MANSTSSRRELKNINKVRSKVTNKYKSYDRNASSSDSGSSPSSDSGWDELKNTNELN